MKTSIFNRSMALFLAFLLCFTTFISSAVTPAFAAATQSEVCVLSFPRDGDTNYSANWGHPDLNFTGGWHDKSTRFLSVHAVGSFTGEICYCIEPGVNVLIGDKVSQRDESYWDNFPSNLNPTISPDDIKLLIGRIMQYGFTGTVSIDWRSQNDGGPKLAWATATQLLIWETVVGERDAEFNKVAPAAGKDPIFSEIDTGNPLYTMIKNYYDSMAYNTQNHTKLPSFFARSTGKAQEIALTWDGTQYSATLTDTNNVLSNYTFAANAPFVRCTVSGNQLTISTSATTDGPITITASKNNSQRRGIITWTDGHIGPDGTIQDLVTYTQSVTDPIQGFVKVKISLGSMKIVKTSEDGNVLGIPFTIQGNGVYRTVWTNSAGEIQVSNLTPGTYTVAEQPFDQICTLLEKGVYTVEIFSKRNDALSKEIKKLQLDEADLLAKLSEQKSSEDTRNSIIPATQHILDSYDVLTIEEKNQLWKTVLEKITVFRTKSDKFSIHVYPKVPMQ